MRITGSHVNLTPVFRVETPDGATDPWRRVSGAVQSGKAWLFPAYYPFGLTSFRDLRILVPHAEWDATTAPILSALVTADETWKAAKKAFEQGAEVPMPEGLTFPKGFAPYNHQRMGIIMASTWWRAFFLWEMGTGKTRTIIDAFRLSRRENPKFERVLVMAPAIVLPTWKDEVERCSEGELKSVIWDGTDKTIEASKEANFVIVSYPRARMEFDTKVHPVNRLIALDYQQIVADESHCIGNTESLQTQAVLSLSSKAARRYTLTGTAGDHPGKLYPQVRFLSPGLMPMNWTQYKDNYFVFSKYQKGRVFGYKRLDDLNSRIENISTRMKKSDCLDLPDMTFVDISFDLTGEQELAYDACIARLKDFDLYKEQLAGHGVASPNGGALVNKLLQIVSGFAIEGSDPMICDGCVRLLECFDNKIAPYTELCAVVKEKPPTTIRRFDSRKKEVFKALLDNILSDSETNKVICWGTYIEELNDIQKAVEELGVSFVRIDGKTTSRIKEYSGKFQTDPLCRVYIGQVTSGVGINLTAANYAIYYALTWNLTAYKQSLERNNRPGQTRAMTVYRLLSTHKIALDRFLARMLQFKDNVAYTMLERVACAPCEMVGACAVNETKPFRTGCKYKANVDKPTASAEYLTIRSRE